MSFLRASALCRAAAVPMIVGAMLLASCSGGSLGSASSRGGGASGTVKLGLSVPKSGTNASLAKDMEQGFKLYMEEKNNKLGGQGRAARRGRRGQRPADLHPGPA